MNQYEILYILDAGIDEAAREAEIEKFSAVIGAAGGEILELNKWGVKKFAYEIDFKREGYYVLMRFSAGADVPAEIERKMRISDSVIRFKTIKK